MNDRQYENWLHDEYCQQMYRATSMAVVKNDHSIQADMKGIPYPTPFLTGKGGQSLLGLINAIAKAHYEHGAKITSEYKALKTKHELSDEWFQDTRNEKERQCSTSGSTNWTRFATSTLTTASARIAAPA